MALILLGVFHLLVDEIKCIVQKCVKSIKYELLIFAVDQIIHLGILFVISFLCTITYDTAWLPCDLEENLNSIQKAPVYICAFLFCGKPAAIIVSLVFELIPKTIKKADYESVKIIGGSQKENVRIGLWIGILERNNTNVGASRAIWSYWFCDSG